MIFYLGASGDTKTLEAVSDRPDSIGMLVQRGQLSRVRPWMRWAYDNGAYSDFINSRKFDADAFVADLIYMQDRKLYPAWCVIPDIVQGGQNSLRYSLEWMDHAGTGNRFNWLLPVQDGMIPEAVRDFIGLFGGLFVGGSARFKATLPLWVKMAHDTQRICHLGRSSTVQRILWAKMCGADSCDSAFFQWTRERMAKLLALADAGWTTPQMFFEFMKNEEFLNGEALTCTVPDFGGPVHSRHGSSGPLPDTQEATP